MEETQPEESMRIIYDDPVAKAALNRILNRPQVPVLEPLDDNENMGQSRTTRSRR